jgi:hypothetical protein
MTVHRSLEEEALSFLRGTKTSESMSPSLQDALYVPIRFADGTTLEEVLVDVLQSRRDVIVSGTAGGGKTALVERIVREIAESGGRVAEIDEVDVIDQVNFNASVLVIRDLTATGGELASEVWSRSPRPPLLLAGNEGALLDHSWGDIMRPIVTDLRSLQEGESPLDSERVVVVDMAAIDPIRQGLAEILSHELIHGAIHLWEQSMEQPVDSPRLLALRQLQDPNICKSATDVLRRALGPGEVTYRELWNFVSEILLEGDNHSTPPTSTWFWRLFYGDSKLSIRLLSAAKPNYLSLPASSMAIYNNDLSALNLTTKALQNWVPVGANPKDSRDDVALDIVRWNRIQYVVMTNWLNGERSTPFVGIHHDIGSRSTPNLSDLIALMNGFFHGMKPFPGHGLELWIDLGVERKDERPPGIVSLGVISLSQLRVVPSFVIANVEGRQIPGARQFLRAEGAGGSATSLEITARLINGLQRRRSLRTFHRSGDEIDLALKRFYFACARVCSTEEPNVLEILYTQEAESSRIIRWRVSERISHLGGESV